MIQLRIVLCLLSCFALGCTKFQDATIGARNHTPDVDASTADASDQDDVDGGHEEDAHEDDESHHEDDDDEVHATDGGEQDE